MLNQKTLVFKIRNVVKCSKDTHELSTMRRVKFTFDFTSYQPYAPKLRVRETFKTHTAVDFCVLNGHRVSALPPTKDHAQIGTFGAISWKQKSLGNTHD